MKNLIIVFLFCLSSVFTFAQYKGISVDRSPKSLEVIQVDYRESSTLVFFKYTSEEGVDYMNINEKAFIRPKGHVEKYPLINSINLPISSEAEQKYMIFDYVGQTHCFALEFKQLPNDFFDFDIVEDDNDPNGFNVYGIHLDTLSTGDLINIDNFVANYPVKEGGTYVRDNNVISYVKANDIILTICVQVVKQYGKYFTVNMDLQNFSGRSILFNLNNIKSEGYIVKNAQIKKTIPLEILSAYEFDKTVAHKQAWNNFWVGLGEGFAAYNAGKSSSTTTYSGSAYTSGSASAYGYVGNNYGYARAYGSAYTTAYGKSHTDTYNGAAAYAAQQQANANYERYASNQYEIRQLLNDGYAKNNTIQNSVEYSGFFNIKYKKIDIIKIVFTIDGITFPFALGN